MHAFRLAALVAGLLLPASASAFCGFYVAQGDKKLTNDATMVVMMRQGTRTVLAMQNDYAGPPEDFAMVIPVPVVLQAENVKTLERTLFDRVDVMTAPRLVEYWEQDPCPPEEEEDLDNKEGGTGTRAKGEEGSMGNRFGVRVPEVKIEAKFAVGEYEVVILSANDALALDQWLKDNHYKIPDGAEPVLRGYLAQGSKFFVARVDAKKVAFEGGRARLSPLRFHYDTDTFSLPVRLGLLNASGHQDLVVNIIADKRFDVVNYPKATMPTNVEIDENAMSRFGEINAALLDAVQAKTPGAVVTEYAWQIAGCDPCPGPVLTSAELRVLGGDALARQPGDGWVVTRLHARYTKEQLGADLVFGEAPPIEGGREEMGAEARAASVDNFQTRIIARHSWTGPISCADPVRGIWGGPPRARQRLPRKIRDPQVPRGKLELASILRTSLDAVGVKGRAAPAIVEEPRWSPRARFGFGGLLGLVIAAFAGAISERARK